MHNLILSPISFDELDLLILSSVKKAFAEFQTNQLQTNNYPQSEIVFLEEACLITGLKKATLYCKNSTGELKAHKVNGQKKIYYLRAELMQFIQSGKNIS